MTTPFDAIAARYDELWSATPKGLDQRRQVWREIDDLFTSRTAPHILDLGCGIGDDALHLQSRIRVTAIDASQEMVSIAAQRGVDVRCLSIEQLSALEGLYDGALSNFGAFNCIGDPAAAARGLAMILRPGAHFAMCVLTRFYWREFLALNFRRWPGHANWRGLDVYYRTSRQWQRAFAAHFTLVRRTAIGAGDHDLYIWRRT
jgi:SAM-dependent methyltransferase